MSENEYLDDDFVDTKWIYMQLNGYYKRPKKTNKRVKLKKLIKSNSFNEENNLKHINISTKCMKKR